MSVDVPCKCPLPPNNGFTSTCSGYVSTGYKLSYHCSNTHKLVGVQSRTCQGNGTWTGSDPFCVQGRVSCHQQKLSQSSAEITLDLTVLSFITQVVPVHLLLIMATLGLAQCMILITATSFTIATVAILCMEVIPIDSVDMMVLGRELLLPVPYKVSILD